ncbi:MAG: DoxX family protein [Bacteroidota bacterium]
MKKSHKVIYWIATVWLSLGMASTGILQMMKMQEEIDNFNSLGYPIYLMTIIGAWKIAGVIAVLVPKFTLLKEWAYAGFFFAMSGAIISHLAVGHGGLQVFGPSLLLVLTVVSWYFIPANRKMPVAIA